MEQKTIGSFIATLRKAKGLTQKQLAEILGVSDKTISHWERDESAPDLSILPVIADIFSVTCDELLRGEKRADTQTPAEAFSVKSEKQIKYIIEKSLSKHKNLALISCAVALLGFFVGYAVINLVFSSLAVAFVFYVAAAVIIALSHIQFISKLIGDEFDGELLKTNKLKANELSFYSAISIIFIAAFSIPHLLGFYDFWGAMSIDLIIVAVLIVVFSFVTVRLKTKEIIPSKLSAKQNKKIIKLRVIVILTLTVFIGSFALFQLNYGNDSFGYFNHVHPVYCENEQSFVELMQTEKSAPKYADEKYRTNRPDTDENGLYYIPFYDEDGNETRRRTFEWKNESVAYYDIEYVEDDGNDLYIDYVNVYTYQAIHKFQRHGPIGDLLFMLGYAYYPLVIIICAAVYFTSSKRIKNGTGRKKKAKTEKI